MITPPPFFDATRRHYAARLLFSFLHIFLSFSFSPLIAFLRISLMSCHAIAPRH